jgi:hypothetical protein
MKMYDKNEVQGVRGTYITCQEWAVFCFSVSCLLCESWLKFWSGCMRYSRWRIWYKIHYSWMFNSTITNNYYMALVRERNIPTQPKLVPTFADRGRRVVGATDTYGRNLGFLNRSRYSFFQVARQLYSRGWVKPVPDPLLRKFGSDGNRTRTSESVARNADH